VAYGNWRKSFIKELKLLAGSWINRSNGRLVLILTSILFLNSLILVSGFALIV
jgi:hypothetical protein